MVTGDDGSQWTFRAGDAFVSPAGFLGTWEIVEPAKKSMLTMSDYSPPKKKPANRASGLSAFAEDAKGHSVSVCHQPAREDHLAISAGCLIEDVLQGVRAVAQPLRDNQ